MREDSTVTFYWIGELNEGAEISNTQGGGIEYFTIEVPTGFTVEHFWYGEGLITTLNYSDGTTLNLHFGGNLKFSEEVKEANSEVPSPTKNGSIRFGQSNGKFWGAYFSVYCDMVNVVF